MWATVFAASSDTDTDHNVPMAVAIEELCRDLETETAALRRVLAELTPAAWRTPTPAAEWTVFDQIGHLAYFDEAVTTAVTDPDAFRAGLAALGRDRRGFVDDYVAATRGVTPAALVERWTLARAAMIDAFQVADPTVRVPWYGPAMSVGSALTARIMETWAHGQDVYDALGQPHPATAAVHHVAFIGVRSLPNSFTSHGLQPPDSAVDVTLTPPPELGTDGEAWHWGTGETADSVSGSAVDFCLVVTQRRHVQDTSLVARGDIATRWLQIAQAFAGPPGPGRRPGQFA